MSALSVQPTFPIFTDVDGQPLEDGYIWIGTVNLPAQTNQISVYWDAGLTIPAAQPIRTLGGYPANNGTPARLYVNSDYSILVQNKLGSLVYSAPAATERYNGGVISTINASQVVYDPAGTGAVATTVQAKLRESVSVKDFGAVGDGVTDDTAALTAAFSWLANGTNRKLVGENSAIYLVSGPVVLTNASYYVIDMAGATVKMKNGTAIAYATDVFRFESCSNGKHYNMIADGNRANRTPIAAAHGMNFKINTSCSALEFVDCLAINSVGDGWYVDSATPTVLASAPTDIVLRDCVGLNSYRNNLSLICSNRFRMYGGRMNGANGTNPEGGIDVEPDISTDVGNIDAQFFDVEVADNNGYGFACILSNSHAHLHNWSARNNVLGALKTSGGTITSNGARIYDHGTATTRGVIDATSGAVDVYLNDTRFSGVTTGSSNRPLIYLHSGITGDTTVTNTVAVNCDTVAIQVWDQDVFIDGLRVKGMTAARNGFEIQSSANRARVYNVDIDMNNKAARGIYVGAPDVVMKNIFVCDSASTTASIDFDTTALRPTLDGCNVLQKTLAPAAYGVQFLTVPLYAGNIICKGLVTDYTTANGIYFSAGVAGGFFGEIKPQPAAYDSFTPTVIGTTSSGAGTYTTQSGKGFLLGDKFWFDISLTWTAHTGTGNMDLSNLPVTSSSSMVSSQVHTIFGFDLAYGAGKVLGAITGASSNQILLRTSDQAGGAIGFVALDTAGSLRVRGYVPI